MRTGEGVRGLVWGVPRNASAFIYYTKPTPSPTQRRQAMSQSPRNPKLPNRLGRTHAALAETSVNPDKSIASNKKAPQDEPVRLVRQQQMIN